MATEVEEPPSEEEQLLEALRKKADAFSNKEWEAYWLREGPALLTNGWLATHPDIPLANVEGVCSLEFLSSAIKNLSLESYQSHEVVGEDEEYSTESIVAVSGGREEGVKITAEMKFDSEMEVSSAHHEGAAVVTEPMASCEETSSSSVRVAGLPVEDKTVTEVTKGDSSTDVAALSSEAIVAMWNEHYNSYYWYIYEAFVQEGGGEQQLLPREGKESQDSEAMEPQDREVRDSILWHL